MSNDSTKPLVFTYGNAKLEVSIAGPSSTPVPSVTIATDGSAVRLTKDEFIQWANAIVMMLEVTSELGRASTTVIQRG